MNEGVVPVIAVGAICLLLIPLLWVVSVKNNFARLRNLIRESWSNVDVALKRRHDLVPNLVETCKAYASYEQQTLDKVIRARNEAVAHVDSVRQQAANEAVLTAAITGLIARIEAYPELKASTQYLELQQELANTEDRIAAARRFYNANVRDYKIACETFPGSLLAGGEAPPDFFEFDGDFRSTPSVAA